MTIESKPKPILAQLGLHRFGEFVRFTDAYEFHLKPGFRSAIFDPQHMWIYATRAEPPAEDKGQKENANDNG
jgi:hypothetical protein